MIKSKALEVNLASYHVDVAIDDRYAVLQEIMSKYYGLTESFNTFLKELSHPYKNWSFIVTEARRYSLEYFHLLESHPSGPLGISLYVDIFTEAIAVAGEIEVKREAVDNLLLLLQKLIRESRSGIGRFLPVMNDCFDRILALDDEVFFHFVKSYYQLSRLGEGCLEGCRRMDGAFESINALLVRYYRVTYTYWSSIRDPLRWFMEEAREVKLHGNLDIVAPLFEEISHRRLQALQAELEEIVAQHSPTSESMLQKLLALPSFGQIAENYRQIAQKLLEAGRHTNDGKQWKFIFLFHIMNISGLSNMHEEALRDINRTVGWLIANETDFNIRRLMQKTFMILKEQSVSYPATALNCVLNMGKGINKTDDSELVNHFIDNVIELGFQWPKVSGVGDDWQVRVNSAHILNIRTWLQLIEINPKWSTRLLSFLIIHIALGGVFIKDTDLFPRDVTRLLNGDIGPVYNLVKQLARLFPVYFNDIGAEGKLRDISTRIDEITHRKDILIHFLRKQSHVESSNQILEFMRAIVHFWRTREKESLESFVPPSVYEQIESSGPFIDGVHHALSSLEEKGLIEQRELLSLEAEDLNRALENNPAVRAEDRERVILLVALYKMLYQKYNTDMIELNSYLNQLATEAFPGLNRLKTALGEPDLKKKLFMLLEYLGQLKSIILSPDAFEVREDIYKKRHITIDIPSMYGSYHELKFDALGLTFRIEALINVLFEELIEDIDLSLITKATFYQIYARLRLFDKALRLDGIASVEIERQLDLLAHSLEVKGFTFTQYLDIFKGFAEAAKNIINDFFHNVHDENLVRVLKQIDFDQPWHRRPAAQGIRDLLPGQNRPVSRPSAAGSICRPHPEYPFPTIGQTAQG